MSTITLAGEKLERQTAEAFYAAFQTHGGPAPAGAQITAMRKRGFVNDHNELTEKGFKALREFHDLLKQEQSNAVV